MVQAGVLSAEIGLELLQGTQFATLFINAIDDDVFVDAGKQYVCSLHEVTQRHKS